uniref:Capsid protein n=1 Tax=Circoviridae sp. TaxID=1954248 RepID=A0A6M3YNB9_9VIRU|nr:MAG: capsid protein [Circoviridae sp.]
MPRRRVYKPRRRYRRRRHHRRARPYHRRHRRGRYGSQTLWKLSRQFPIKIPKATNPQGGRVWATNYLTFKLSDFTTAINVSKVPWEYFRMKLIKVRVFSQEPSGSTNRSIGHQAVVKEDSILQWKKQDLPQDPVANLFGSRVWGNLRGFKRLLRPQPLITGEKSNQFFSRKFAGWIPLQPPNDGMNTPHYGIVFSMEQEPGEIEYMCELTMYGCNSSFLILLQ